MVLVVLAGLVTHIAASGENGMPWYLGYLLPGALIAAMSLLDDLYGLSSLVRLIVHCATATIAVAACLMTADSSPLGAYGQWAFAIASVVWIVGLTNAFNFMDGIDGIAGSQAAVAGLGWCALGLGHDMGTVSLIGALVAGSSLGFLFHNWPPARIFMGDVGSTFIGFTLALLTVLAGSRNPLYAVSGALLVWPFVADATYTFLRRLRNGENVLKPHRSHLYQRLVVSGWSHRAVTLLYTAMACLGLTAAILLPSSPAMVLVIALAMIVTVFAALLMIVRRAEASAERGLAKNANSC